MKSVLRISPLLLLSLCAPNPGWPQPVYRCGNSYGHVPCTGAVVVPADDPRSPQQKADTDRAAQRDAELAHQMEQARLQKEAQVQVHVQPQPAPARHQRAAHPGASAAKPAAAKPKAAPHFRAFVPKPPNAAHEKKAAGPKGQRKRKRPRGDAHLSDQAHSENNGMRKR